MSSPRLRLRFLGACEIADRRGPVHLESTKTTALLALLALSRGPQSRSRLMGLLWPELSEERAAGNLRRAVWDLRRKLAAGGEAPVRASRVDLELVRDGSVDLDVVRFEEAAARMRAVARGREAELSGRELAELEEGVELYRGELLAGLAVDEALEFEEWLVAERERLRHAAERGLARLVAVQRARGDLSAAIAHTRRLLALDPWREEVHRGLMELLVAAGDPAAALAQFEACRRLLAEQLQAAPSAETTRLAEGIRRAATGPSRRGAAVAEVPPNHNLPTPGTPFVGRERELAAILAELDRAGCRLLSLVGPGGVGKTRLALRLGQTLVNDRELSARFPDGVHFVGPREVAARGALGMALAEVLGLAPRATGEGAEDLEATLLAAVRGRRMLILLDGLEHQLVEGGDDMALLSRLLAATAETKIVATTRERLLLPDEWVFEVGGLDLPSKTGEGEGAAVGLFVQTARRVRLGWRPTAAELPRIGEICRRLEGLPLGIELAAAWVGSLSVGEIADEIGRDLAGIDPPERGAASARRGLRGVFEASWSRLSGEERRALAATAHFVGGFTRAAAERAAEVRLSTLRSLVDRSFLRYDPAGRYSLHEVLRHFAAEHLAHDPELLAATARRHARYFAERLAALVPRPADGLPRAASREIASELENVQAAWRWGVSNGEAEIVAGCLDAVAAFAASSGWRRAGEEMLDLALDAIEASRAGHGSEETARLAARLRAARGALRNRTGDTRRARADLLGGRRALRRVGERAGAAAALYHLGECDYLEGRYRRSAARLGSALAEMRELAAPELVPEALGRIGRVELELGRHAEAEAAFAASLAAARAAEMETAELFALNQLGYVSYFAGRAESAEARFREAFDRAGETGDRAAAAAAATGLAYVAEDRGEFASAREGYELAVALARELGDRRGEAYGLMLLGEAARREACWGEARNFYGRSREIAAAIGSQYLLGLLAGNLAYVAAACGESREARSHVRETLAIYRQTGAMSVGLPAFVAAAEVEIDEGRCETGLRWLAAVRRHPGNRQDHQSEVERVRRKAQGIGLPSGAGSGEQGDDRWPAVAWEDLLVELEAWASD